MERGSGNKVRNRYTKRSPITWIGTAISLISALAGGGKKKKKPSIEPTAGLKQKSFEETAGAKAVQPMKGLSQ